MADHTSDYQLLQETLFDLKSLPSTLSSSLSRFLNHPGVETSSLSLSMHSSQSPSLSYTVGTDVHWVHPHTDIAAPVDYEYTGRLVINELTKASQGVVKIKQVSNQLQNSKSVWIGLQQDVRNHVYSVMPDTMCYQNLRARIQQGFPVEPSITYTFNTLTHVEIPLFRETHLLASLFNPSFEFYPTYEDVLRRMMKNSEPASIILSLPVNANLTCQLVKRPANINLLAVSDIASTLHIHPYSVQLEILFNFTSQPDAGPRRLEEDSLEHVLDQVTLPTFDPM